MLSRVIVRNIGDDFLRHSVNVCNGVCMNFMAADAYVWNAIIYCSDSIFVRTPSSEVIERNSTELCHVVWSETDLKMVVQIWNFPFNEMWGPQLPIFWQCCDFRANIFGMKVLNCKKQVSCWRIRQQQKQDQGEVSSAGQKAV